MISDRHPVPFQSAWAPENGVAVVTVRGELDLLTVERFDKTTREVAAARLPAVVDLRECTFADSTAVNALMKLRRRLGQANHLVICCPAAGPVATVLRISGCDQILDVRHDYESALAASRT